jgi:hypothetical protein
LHRRSNPRCGLTGGRDRRLKCHTHGVLLVLVGTVALVARWSAGEMERRRTGTAYRVCFPTIWEATPRGIEVAACICYRSVSWRGRPFDPSAFLPLCCHSPSALARYAVARCFRNGQGTKSEAMHLVCVRTSPSPTIAPWPSPERLKSFSLFFFVYLSAPISSRAAR